MPPVGGGSCDVDGEPPLTHVTLVWQQSVLEDWLRFGKPVAGRILDRRTRIESYAPGQVFALVGWASNDFGTVRSTLGGRRDISCASVSPCRYSRAM